MTEESRPGPFEERVATACWAAVPVVVVLGVIAMLQSPEIFAETGSADGSTPWGGAILGLATFLLFTAAPLVFFGHALRAGTRGRLMASALLAAGLGFYGGVLPLLGGLVEGWGGVSVLAVLTAAGVAVLDGFVVAAAVQGIGRIDRDRAAPA